MWADDSWLKEHAGATLNTEAEEEADGDTKDKESKDTTKEDTTTVRNLHLLFRISVQGHVINDDPLAVHPRTDTVFAFAKHVHRVPLRTSSVHNWFTLIISTKSFSH